MGARGIALGIDSLLLLVAAYFVHLLGAAARPGLLRALPPPARANPGQMAARHPRRSVCPVDASRGRPPDPIRRLCLGPLAWTLLAAFVYTLHSDEHVSFQLSSLSLSQLAVPIVYIALATIILVGYLAGFLLVAFHPKRQAVHDLLAKTVVYHQIPRPRWRDGRGRPNHHRHQPIEASLT
jgi:uncharacterized RDD family membrane protein YckC